MSNERLPETDSIKELAEFWDSHDLTDFDDQLEDVTEPVFVRSNEITISLDDRESDEIDQLARAEGLSREQLVQKWIRSRISRHQ